jgi:hypothetical protein
MSAQRLFKREIRVMFSRKVQPIWFRVLKWIIILGVAILFWRRPYFWWGIAVTFVLGFGLHLFWRWKTKGWTQPWGGWDDIEADNES